ncbi:hypothetical protein PG999_005490 [Apiospora kogelbergensis]|uniref:Lipoprotein n=1 Tax=Apiospora kogelbergensis TaxID=1337665 RepID=A0AAW0R2E6_9PEZI
MERGQRPLRRVVVVVAAGVAGAAAFAAGGAAVGACGVAVAERAGTRYVADQHAQDRDAGGDYGDGDLGGAVHDHGCYVD